jgi:hypothetical protein
MPRHAARFRQADVTRVVKAALAAGLVVDRVEIDADGKIAVVTASAPPPSSTSAADLAVERWREKRARASQGGGP